MPRLANPKEKLEISFGSRGQHTFFDGKDLVVQEKKMNGKKEERNIRIIYFLIGIVLIINVRNERRYSITLMTSVETIIKLSVT